MTGLALEGIFMTFVMFVLAVAPFVIIWRWPATLLTKSLMTVVALLFFTMILMSVGHTAAKGYANFTFSPCLDMLGKTLSDEKVDPADVSAVIHEWRENGNNNYQKLKDTLKNMPSETAEPLQEAAEPPPKQAESPAEQPTAAPAEPPASE